MSVNYIEQPNTEVVFSRDIPSLGRFDLRPFSLEKDTAFLHEWVNQPYAQYWGMLNSSVQEVHEAYRDLLATPGYEIYVAFWQGKPVFMTECYDPTHDLLANYYEVQPGDRGMHVLVAPPDQKIKGFTWAVFTTVMDFLFANEGVKRVVVEPDLRNDKIHALNKRAGFVYNKVLTLPHKTAHLAFCTHAQYTAARKALRISEKKAAIDHLAPLPWEEVNRALVGKALSEFAHELLLKPTKAEGNANQYVVHADDPQIRYEFVAQRFALDHWHIAHESICKYQGEEVASLDLLHFIAEFQEQLEIPEEFRATYLEEIGGTLYAAAYKWRNERFDAKALVKADFQEVEHAMREGHPCFLANNGKMGLSPQDFERYTPEADVPFRLVWLAGHKDYAQYTGIEGLPYEQLLEQELGTAQVAHFHQQLTNVGLSPDDYVLMPVHPWQWANKLVYLYAADIAQRRLVCVGESTDLYSAQQSVRTLFNASDPEKHYTKTSMGITNMGFMRGLSPYYMQSTPAITDWVRGLLGSDAFLQQCGFEMLDEVATVGYRHKHFEALGRAYPQNKMLAALWRQSPAQKMEAHQKVMTMAALLHVDTHGQALLPLLIQDAGVTVEAWLKAYLKCYFTPLLHCFFEHGLVFMPHGENLLLVLEDNVPVKALMKDITEEVLLYDNTHDLPERVQRLYTEASDEMQILSLFTDVFDCFFRFLSVILHTQANYQEEEFWQTVHNCIRDYQRAHPEHAAKYERYDLFVPEFKRCCLNRLQLGNHKQMLNLADPINSLKLVSVLKNPVSFKQ
ncbi:GNAT family N-acetyltransferase [Microscilla marina]|uniref:Siderophore biosynthesis protein, IucA/IucC family n=1 Tax=Microscilla marina ATCC 23134 TaxID=313606 RepID=A1ZRI1_MICM2|nr:GNAT family N-acetyltransferase [Microscilla marina]EAY27071.1 siderophore biosynthesis protein, IucA/IucC family [Microscilla marina ATCC 23134]